MENEIMYKELSYQIVGIAMEVHNQLGFGFLEKVYENSLYILLKKNGIKVEKQYPIEVVFENEIVGEYIADLIVENRIIIELKTCSSLVDSHKAQVLNYLKATNIKLGILINFGTERLQYKRVINNMG